MTDQPIPTPEEPELWIEFPEPYGVVGAGLGDDLEQMKQHSQQAMNVAMSVIRSMAYRVSRTMQEIQDGARPDEMEVEFSLKLELEGGAVVPMVAKTTLGGQFNIKLKWDLEKPQRPVVLVSENK